jgi:hypothetical protein
MKRITLRALALTLICVLGSAAAVAAADFCVDVHSAFGDNLIVLKAFSVPAAGACTQARGFFKFGSEFMSGSACGSSDRVSIHFLLTTTISHQLFTEEFALLRAALTTPVNGFECIADGSFCSIFSYFRTTCSPSTIPVPQ